MEHRDISKSGRLASVVGLGTWQLGADWGQVDEDRAMVILQAAVDNGVTFFDTADVYGDGRSERLIGRFLAGSPSTNTPITVATKMGRRVAQDPANFTLDHFRAWTDRSRKNLGVDSLDLVQLHCPPSEVLLSDRVYDALDSLVDEGRVQCYGVSVESCADALSAMERPRLASVQIILNPFRQKPIERVLPVALDHDVAIIARVPLASGLLSGKFTSSTVFASDDHRRFNRHGERFDVGETFSGIDFEIGIEAAVRFGRLAPAGFTPAQLALRWIIDRPGITTVIPGATSAAQVVTNARAAELPVLDCETNDRIRELYESAIKVGVHHKW